MAELGAKLTKEAGDGERAARLLGIAARLWSRLGRAEDVARVDESSGRYVL